MDQESYSKLAEQFVGNTTKTGEGDYLGIALRGVCPEGRELAEACKLEAERLGAKALIIERGSEFVNSVMANATPEGLLQAGAAELELVKPMTTFISICDDDDLLRIKREYDQGTFYKTMRPAQNQRVNHARWLVVDAPTPAFAKANGMDVPTAEAYYKKVCLLDYSRMAQQVIPLQELMDNTEHVRITGPGTDLSFSIKGLKSVPCVGERNIPDGECYTAPEKFSVQGRIQFGPSSYQGSRFTGITLEYNKGYISKAIGATPEETVILNKILDTDPGARFTGEFAVGFNPYITRPMGRILFDEKIGGSIHIAQGQAYEGIADNGNRSAVHWDMVHSQRPEHGGGQLWFDDKLIRHDGRFVIPDLDGLNPENLMG